MEKRQLGKSDIKISRLGLGSLTMGGLQRGSDPKTVERVVAKAIERGINFVDGAELYKSYNVLAEFVKQDKESIIATKSYAYDIKTATTAFEEALREINRDYIDIFLMHEQESEHTIRGHYEALEFYLKMKQQGKIRAVGLSTHKVQCVKDSLKFKEIEIVHPLFNKTGLGIFDGSRLDMENAVKAVVESGKGVYAMKIFGGGHLLNDRLDSAKYFLSQDYVHGAVIGMQTQEEVNFNADIFEGKVPSMEVEISNKEVKIHDWCIGCACCVKACPQDALKIEDGKCVCQKEKCILCGYCGSACPELAIKLF